MHKVYVQSLFNAIAYRYDVLNHLLSGGIDVYWRRRAIEKLRTLAPQRILDVGTGTADFAIAALRLHPAKVIGVDIADEMLSIGREKLAARGLNGVVELQPGEAESLPFGDGTFDAAIVAFGVRNFENLTRGIEEMQRVLRPGGQITVLEFSRPRSSPFRQIYFFYFRHLLPIIGAALSHHREAYTYLPDTVLRFPEGEEFLAILAASGFERLEQERLTFGIATVYTGRKPDTPI